MTSLTPSQLIAITEHRKNLIVSAGAGSGKTHVLVERYLALLQANPTWHLNHIVAITFTRKAADEMRDRVRNTLEKNFHDASAQNDTLWAERWARWLGEIDGAQIDTIHSLCANLLRANFAEAGLDPTFIVLDEVQAALLLEQAVSDTFVDLADAPHPTPEMMLFDHYPEYVVQQVLTNPSLLASEVRPIADINTAYADFLHIIAQSFIAYANKLGANRHYHSDERWDIFYTAYTMLRTDSASVTDALTHITTITFRKKLDEPTKSMLTALRDHAKTLLKQLDEAQKKRPAQ